MTQHGTPDPGRESLSIIGIALLLAGAGLFAHSMGWLDDLGLDLWQLWPVVPVVIGARSLRQTEGVARVFSFLFLVGGLLALAANLHWLDDVAMPSVVTEGLDAGLIWAALLGLAGVAFLTGGRPFFIRSKRTEGRRLQQLNIFGGQELSLATNEFAGGWAAAVFGGFELDLTECQMAGPEARLELVAFCGGGEIHVPKGWRVELSGLPLFGGFGSKAKVDPELRDTAPVLRINAVAVFGGFEVNNG